MPCWRWPSLGPLFGYLMVLTNGMIGFPLVWWGSTFLLPWRIVPPLVVLLVRGARFSLRAPAEQNPPSIFSYR